MTNDTQEIDAGALRARLAETPADLRGRIEAALQSRYCATVRVTVGMVDDKWMARARVGDGPTLAMTAHHGSDDAALMALAEIVGLSANGTCPRAEVERLRAEVAAARTCGFREGAEAMLAVAAAVVTRRAETLDASVTEEEALDDEQGYGRFQEALELAETLAALPLPEAKAVTL